MVRGSTASSSFSIDAQFPTPIISLTPNDPSVCNGTDGSILVSGVGSGTVTWNGIVSGNDNTAVLNYSIIELLNCSIIEFSKNRYCDC